MRMLAGAGLLVWSIFASGAASASAQTTVALQGGNGRDEVCRFRADDGEDPFRRWLASQDVTCTPAASGVRFPPGLWNVFARSNAAVSRDPLLVDGDSAPATLTMSVAPGATLALQLPPGLTAVVYAPKHAIAFPAADRMLVPADEELWLFVLAKSALAAVVVISPIPAGSERQVDTRDLQPTPAVVGWVHIPDSDRAALKTARGVSLPHIRIASAGKETDVSSLPALEALHGAFVLLPGVPAKEAELQLTGRGWLSFRRALAIGPQPVTFIRQPIEARASATLVVNWSTLSDLAALDRSVGSCDPSTEPPRFDLTISSCAAPLSGGTVEPATCQPIRKEALELQAKYGSVTVEEVRPGFYRAELRFGKLPPTVMTSVLLPWQQQPIRVQTSYLQVYGSLTRGGQPLGEDARIDFPGGGIGFAPRDRDEYHAVLLRPVGADAKVDIITCRGERMFVLTDQPMMRNARFDLDIPDNILTITVVDTFTRTPLERASVRCTVMSAAMRGRGGVRLPSRNPVITLQLTHDDPAHDASDRGERVPGRFTIRGVPEREIQLQASCPGYKKKDVEPFSMTRSEKKEIEVQLVPLRGSEAKIVSARPFEKATIFWFTLAGVETERADLAPDGTFVFEETHFRGETMTVVSLSHPLWITPAPAVERAKPLQIRFPDAPAREAEVWLPNFPPQLSTLVGVTIGGLRVPGPAFVQHLALRGIQPLVNGAGPLHIPALAETGPIDILRGPSIQRAPSFAPPDAIALRSFAPVATRRLMAGSNRIVFDGK
jgi:hypothetical protein